MDIWALIQDFIQAHSPLSYWLIFFLLAGFIAAFGRGYLAARKIQPNGFRWKKFRRELFFAAIHGRIHCP